jgi:hypothetical protein
MKQFLVFAFLILATFALTKHQKSHIRTQSHEEIHMQKDPKDPIRAELRQKLPFGSSED